MEKYSCSLPSFFRKVERKNMAENYAKIRDGGKGVGLHYRAFEGSSRVVALNLRQLRREDFQIATRIREVGLKAEVGIFADGQLKFEDQTSSLTACTLRDHFSFPLFE